MDWTTFKSRVRINKRTIEGKVAIILALDDDVSIKFTEKGEYTISGRQLPSIPSDIWDMWGSYLEFLNHKKLSDYRTSLSELRAKLHKISEVNLINKRNRARYGAVERAVHLNRLDFMANEVNSHKSGLDSRYRSSNRRIAETIEAIRQVKSSIKRERENLM